MKFIYPESGWYMASTGNVSQKYDSTIGVIQQPGNSPYKRLENGVPWCFDNAVYSGKFEVDLWLKKLSKFEKYKSTCIFVVIPDVIGDCGATLAQFSHYRSMVKDFPVALVSQDGIKEQAHNIPWNDFDCLFVGGSDNHKLGKEGAWIIQEAKKRSKWVHVGRVNSRSRVLKFWKVDSWDGTDTSIAPSHVSIYHAATLHVRAMKKSKGLFDDLHSDVFSGDYSSQSV